MSERRVPATRVTVNLPSDGVLSLRAIAARKDQTVTKTLREALAMLFYFDNEIQKGSTVIVVRKDGTSAELIWPK